MLRVASILAFFGYMMALKFFTRKKVNNNLHFCWLFSFLGYAYLSQYWAYNTDVVFEVLNNVVWATLMGVASSTYVIYYDLSVEQIAKRLAFVSFAFIVSAALLGGVSDNGRMSADNNANSLGLMGSQLFIFLFYLSKQKRWKNYFLNVLIIVLSLLTLISGSRKALMIMSLSCIVCLYYEKPTADMGKIFTRIGGIVVLGVVTYFSIMHVDFLYTSIGNRVESYITSRSNELAADGSMITRELMRERAYEIFKQHFWFGAGLNNFKYLTYWNTYSHNNYCELAACLGIIGLLVYYCPLFFYVIKTVEFWLRARVEIVVALLVLGTGVLSDFGLVSYSSISSNIFYGIAIGVISRMRK